jgi:hypothetical protein
MNSILWRVRVTIVAVEVWYIATVSLALVTQHEKRMRVVYCHLWPVRLYHLITHYLINGTIFEGKSYWIQNVGFYFIHNFVWNISYSENNLVK